MMAESGQPISIKYALLKDHFECTICLGVMQNTVTTSCGHRYCEKCILEWMNRLHTCPCCNGSLSNSMLHRDRQFDGLIDICIKEKEAAESALFDSRVEAADPAGNGGDERLQTAVEKVLKKHLKTSLAAHERYFEDLRHQFKSKTHQLTLNTRKEIERLEMDGMTPDALNQINELKAKLAEKELALASDMEQCQQLVAEAFDRYLTEHIPGLDILPVRGNVVLAGKDLAIPVTLQPNDFLTVVQTAVEEGLIQRGDRVIRWKPDGGRVLLVSPVNKQTSYNVPEILADVCGGGDRYPGIKLLPWTSKPVLQFHMKPGSDLVLHDSVVCESDLPKVCYRKQHLENGPGTVDYFTCIQCNSKWICRSCIQVCHKDHNVTGHVFNHKPTWACCYCHKRKMCLLEQNG